MKFCKYCWNILSKNSTICIKYHQKQPENFMIIFLGAGLFCLLGVVVMPFAGETIFYKIFGTLLYLIGAIICLVVYIYDYWYFKSDKFINVKKEVEKYVQDCNELNLHIEELKKSYENFEKTDYGKAEFYDNSSYNYKKSEFKNLKTSQYIYNCSASICNNAKNQPFKYLCKYFNIDITEETLEKIEKVFNDFSSAEQGKSLLKNKKDTILKDIDKKVPFIIKIFDYDRFIRELGFKPINLYDIYFPKYSFVYVSDGGNSSIRCDITFDLENLEKFIDFLSTQIQFRKSVIGQRALMTSSLRTKTKERDHYTCQLCNNSIDNEPNLLLEIDHIMPLSKGGITSEENLQTLCWKCNRTKGNKIL